MPSFKQRLGYVDSEAPIGSRDKNDLC
jgi:hypothetical protein